MLNQKNILLLFIICMVAAATRLIPYEMLNFTAVGALAFMGGAMIENKWLRYILPIGLMAITDLVLNTVIYSEFTGGSFFYDGMFWVYIPFIISVAVGRIILKEASAGKVVFAGLVSGIIFFLISNFGVWMSGSLYPKTAGGLLEAYYMGLPFVRNTLAGNIVFGLAIYAAWEFAAKKSIKKATV